VTGYNEYVDRIEWVCGQVTGYNEYVGRWQDTLSMWANDRIQWACGQMTGCTEYVGNQWGCFVQMELYRSILTSACVNYSNIIFEIRF
jgi:hypothetical protein